MEVTELYYMKIALKSLLKIKNKLEKFRKFVSNDIKRNNSKYIIDHNKSERTDHKCWENAINSYKSSSSVNTINYHREKEETVSGCDVGLTHSHAFIGERYPQVMLCTLAQSLLLMWARSFWIRIFQCVLSKLRRFHKYRLSYINIYESSKVIIQYGEDHLQQIKRTINIFQEWCVFQ
ncbi:hypothetical protein V1478_004200 [Vespula squamosa]|uniref:Uncharacterized protein n=1 Tax=Vespula squamosa TaxID=30214 RepID=A0ABD2BKE1_VESSQ